MWAKTTWHVGPRSHGMQGADHLARGASCPVAARAHHVSPPAAESRPLLGVSSLFQRCFFVSPFVSRYPSRTIAHTRRRFSCRPEVPEIAGGFRSSPEKAESCGGRMAKRHNLAAVWAVVCLLATCLAGAQATMGIVGGPKPVSNFANSVEIDELANFAVDQYRTRQNSLADISFSKVLSAKEQVVQGTMYYLTIEVMEGGVAKQYDAKVWVKPWEGYKELESFSPSAPSHYDPAVDMSANLGDSHE